MSSTARIGGLDPSPLEHPEPTRALRLAPALHVANQLVRCQTSLQFSSGISWFAEAARADLQGGPWTRAVQPVAIVVMR